MKIERSVIALSNLRFHAKHGVLEQEKVVGGDFIVTLKVFGNFSKAVETDSVDDTVNYALLYDITKKEMQKNSALIEHVAGRIGKSVLDNFEMVDSVEVSVTKCNPPMGADCDGATITLIIER